MSSVMLFAEGLISWRQAVDDLGITKELEPKVFAAVKPKCGKLYWKDEVKSALEGILGLGTRPPFAEEGFSSEKEGLKVNAVAQSEGNDLTVLLREMFEWVKPLLATANALGENASPRMLSPDEAAEAMRLNVQTVMKWCREGRITATKMGRKWLIPREEIDRHLHRSRLIHGERKGGAI